VGEGATRVLTVIGCSCVPTRLRLAVYQKTGWDSGRNLAFKRHYSVLCIQRAVKIG
jgi:hypothetical protein